LLKTFVLYQTATTAIHTIGARATRDAAIRIVEMAMRQAGCE
jgi:hypothetical protein